MIEDIDKEAQDLSRLCAEVRRNIPEAPPDIIPWAEEFVIFPKSVRSKHFQIETTPWIKEPLLTGVDTETQITTLVKPVQTGGSVFGEVLLCYWICFWRGFLQYNWSNDKRADERWVSRIYGILEACPPIAAMLAKLVPKIGEVDFGNVFLRNQGAYVDSNLDSDSIPLQLNEEVHAWEPGHLAKARGRSTAVWNFKSVDISNAGMVGDQLDAAFRKGTMQYWEVLCPGCKQYHRMRTQYDKGKHNLGGLRYDADGSRLGKYEYNYNTIRPTIRYSMPCGFEIYNADMATRRRLSLSGRYCEPTNKGAELKHRSYTYEAVSVDFIDWMTLIQEKHSALKARALSDPQPWRRYKCERECIPYDPNDVPIMGLTSLTVGAKKNRDGLAEPKLRLFSLDRQQGTAAKDEFPHWWLVIRDVCIENEALRSLLVYEGKVETDEQVIAILDDHKCNRWHGVADSGDDTTHVYTFCLRYGINAIKGGREQWYQHANGARRIFGVEKPLHAMINRDSVHPYIQTADGMVPDPREPLFWLYAKSGVRELLYWLRASTKYETPEDVSDDYKSHNESEERVLVTHARTGQEVIEYHQLKTRNDLYVCECYIAMQIQQAGLVREQPVTTNEQPTST